MSKPTNSREKEYDPRLFIWTIVFLVVTGISLVSYIVLSDDTSTTAQDFSVPSQLSRNSR